MFIREVYYFPNRPILVPPDPENQSWKSNEPSPDYINSLEALRWHGYTNPDDMLEEFEMTSQRKKCPKCGTRYCEKSPKSFP